MISCAQDVLGQLFKSMPTIRRGLPVNLTHSHPSSWLLLPSLTHMICTRLSVLLQIQSNTFFLAVKTILLALPFSVFGCTFQSHKISPSYLNVGMGGIRRVFLALDGSTRLSYTRQEFTPTIRGGTHPLTFLLVYEATKPSINRPHDSKSF